MGFLLRQNVRDRKAFAGEISACSFLDVLRRYALQRRQFLVDEPPGQANGFQFADGA
nr:hypothetical protein [Tanacetum cinerariifolium]